MSEVVIQLNGVSRSIEVPPDETLLSVLRNRFELTGTKYGCGEGQCGACTVLVDGKAARSCQMPVSEAAGKAITTIEGLAPAGKLHPVQEAFLEAEAFQCGYCTPGMVVGAAGFLASNPNPPREEILKHLSGHICRCGTYPRILVALQSAAAKMKKTP